MLGAIFASKSEKLQKETPCKRGCVFPVYFPALDTRPFSS